MTTAARLVEEFYNGTAEKDWPAWATEAVALVERRVPPEGKRERIEFYEEAMRDPKNHGALALELVYQLTMAVKATSDFEQMRADHRYLVRRLDVALNSEAGAAKQASLCDIVAQVEREGIRSRQSAAPTAGVTLPPGAQPSEGSDAG